MEPIFGERHVRQLRLTFARPPYGLRATVTSPVGYGDDTAMTMRRERSRPRFMKAAWTSRVWILIAWGALGSGLSQSEVPQKDGPGFSPEQIARKEAFLAQHFPGCAAEQPVAGLPEGGIAFAVLSGTGDVLGWWFCTDRMPPVVRGYGGEIGALVAVSREGFILGIEVLRHQETPSYFKRLDPAFFQRFRGRRADGGHERLDAVTGATRSSQALIRDVTDGGAILWKTVRATEPPAAVSGP